MFGASGDIDVEGKKEEGRQRCLGDTERRATGEGVAGRRGFSSAGTWVMPKCMQNCSGWEEGTSPFSGSSGRGSRNERQLRQKMKPIFE